MSHDSSFSGGSGELDPERIEVLRELNSDGPDFFAELSEIFLKRTQALLARLRQGFVSGNAQMVKQCAHSLCGGASNVGAQRMSRLCREIELSASRSTVHTIRDEIDELEIEFQQVQRELARIVARRPEAE